MAKAKTGHTIYVVCPDGDILYLRHVKEGQFKTEKHMTPYRSRLHYGFAIRVKSCKSGKHIDIQCFAAKTPEKEIEAANLIANPLKMRNALRSKSFARSKSFQTKKKETSPIFLVKPPTMEVPIKLLKMIEIESKRLFSYAHELLGRSHRLAGIDSRWKRFKIKSPIEHEVIEAEYEDVTPPRVEHIPGLPAITYSPRIEAHTVH